MAHSDILYSLLTDYTSHTLQHTSLIFTFSFSDLVFQELPYTTLLSRDEQQQLKRYTIDSVAQQFCITRSYLRLILAHFLSADPQEIWFDQTAKGKRFVPDCPISFSISHSRHKGAIVLSVDSLIGIDVEYIRPHYSYQRVANRFFSPLENQWLSSQPIQQQICHFFNIWTGKEAVSKSLGLGISLGFSSFSVIPIHPIITTTLSNPSLLERPSLFSLFYFDLGKDYSGCLSTSSTQNAYQLLCLP